MDKPKDFDNSKGGRISPDMIACDPDCPEVFVPDTKGTITPNGALGGLLPKIVCQAPRGKVRPPNAEQWWEDFDAARFLGMSVQELLRMPKKAVEKARAEIRRCRH